MAENNFKATVQTLFEGMDSFLSSKTVVGEPININDTIILPLVDVSFAVAAGAFADPKKNNGGGGMGGKMTPSSVLVIQGDKIKLVNIRNQDGLTKILDLVPDIVDKLSDKFGGKQEDDCERAAAREKLKDMITEAANTEE